MVLLPKVPRSEKVDEFYNQQKNTIDVFFFGASSVYRGISPLVIWENYGISSYNFGVALQSPVVIYYKFIESLKYQSPKIIVLDGITILNPYDVDLREYFLRTAVDHMRLSSQKFNIANYVKKNSADQTITSYIFPLFRYHTRWTELKSGDFEIFQTDVFDKRGGDFRLAKNPVEFSPDFMKPDGKEIRLDAEGESYYEKIISVCKDKGINVILISLPKTQFTYANHKALSEFAYKHDIKYIDYNMPELMGAVHLKPERDYFDEGHLRMSGAIKVSKHFGEYLFLNFDLVDQRTNPKYINWNEDADKLYNLYNIK